MKSFDFSVGFIIGIGVAIVLFSAFLPSKIIYNTSPDLSAMKCVAGEPVIDMY